MKHLDNLNSKQKEAALHIDGPLLIIAGAGAGKTKTITHRIVNLIKNGIAPEKILAVTFTNKAAKEMRERILAEIEKNTPIKDMSRVTLDTGEKMPFVSTFHSLGVYIIKENARALGLTKYFTILDDGDTTSLIKEIIKEIGLDPKQYEPRKIKNIISREKGKFTKLSIYTEKANDPSTSVGSSYLGKIVSQVWTLYEKRKNKENSLDFDDLLLKATTLLKEREDIRKIYQERWQYIHIDEYQDTNEVQYKMTQLLAENHKNICVVGDTDQCLIKGTKVRMADGRNVPIEKIKKGDMILSNFGGGKLSPSKVTNTRIHSIKNDYLIKITTGKNRKIISTKDHIHFAGYKMGKAPQTFLNYLMYKKNWGYRIGTTSTYTNGKKKVTLGFIQRSNQEHADATWVVGTYKTVQDARLNEYLLSLKYQIPTLPFIPRKGGSASGYVHDKEKLKKIFDSFDTKQSGIKLLSDLGFDQEYPHHIPQSNSTSRLNINITLCADKRGNNTVHTISFFCNNKNIKNKMASIGFTMRKSKTGSKSYRYETIRSSYKELLEMAKKISANIQNTLVVLRARLGGDKESAKDHNNLPQIPAGNIMCGMSLFAEDGYDTVKKIERIKIQNEEVYDLDIERTHNFIANGIVTHNCIYSWRGANLKNILSFEKDYKDTKIVLLEQNYRSTQNILEAANEIIKKNKYRPDKNLFTKNKNGAKIGFYEALDEGDEAEFVATKILEIMDRSGGENILERTLGRSGDDGQRKFSAENFRGESENILSSASDIAILYRANFQSRVLEEAMLKYNVPYQVLGVKFFERKEIKDTLAYLRASLNRESLSDIKRIINFPTRGIGKATIAKIFAGEINSLLIKTRLKIENFYNTLEEIKIKIESEKCSDVIKFTVKKSGIEDELKNGTEEDMERLENIKELVSLALKYDNLKKSGGVEKLLEDASLASDQDSIMLNEEKKEKVNAVKLMTVHASKGLEFKYVFITGLEDGLFPHQKSGENTGEDAEEERRLFYVALTRAKEKLFLSYANFRTIFGSRQINTPSEFLSDIPIDLLEKEGEEDRVKTIYI